MPRRLLLRLPRHTRRSLMHHRPGLAPRPLRLHWTRVMLTLSPLTSETDTSSTPWHLSCNRVHISLSSTSGAFPPPYQHRDPSLVRRSLRHRQRRRQRWQRQVQRYTPRLCPQLTKTPCPPTWASPHPPLLSRGLRPQQHAYLGGAPEPKSVM